MLRNYVIWGTTLYALRGITGAVYARMVKKVGDRRYWEQWAQSVGEIAERQVKRITSLVEKTAPTPKLSSPS